MWPRFGFARRGDASDEWNCPRLPILALNDASTA
jgi:hypothetical protein